MAKGVKLKLVLLCAVSYLLYFVVIVLGSGASPIGLAVKRYSFCTIQWIRSSILGLRRLGMCVLMLLLSNGPGPKWTRT